MKAALLTGFGGIEKLKIVEDWPDPEPAPGDVRVRVCVCGVNNTDIWTRVGAYGTSADQRAPAGPRRAPIAFPRIQGADAVGTIDSVGEGGDDRRIGERVLIDPVVRESPTELLGARYLGSDLDGGFAEYVVVPDSNARPLPEELDFMEAATLATAAGTAMRMVGLADIGRGSRVLVTGAGGGVGSAAVQIAATISAEVIAVSSRPSARAWLTRLGAAEVIGLPQMGQLRGSIDAVIDVISGAQADPLLRTLRRGGVYVIAGASGGAESILDMRTIYLGHLRLHGTSLFTLPDLDEVLSMVQEGKFRPQLDRAFPLREIADAQERFQSRSGLGKIVITIP